MTQYDDVHPAQPLTSFTPEEAEALLSALKEDATELNEWLDDESVFLLQSKIRNDGDIYNKHDH
jgi:hypothetical protein